MIIADLIYQLYSIRNVSSRQAVSPTLLLISIVINIQLTNQIYNNHHLIKAVYTAQYPWGLGGEKANPLGRKLESLAKTKGTRCRYTLFFLKRKGLGKGLGTPRFAREGTRRVDLIVRVE